MFLTLPFPHLRNLVNLMLLVTLVLSAGTQFITGNCTSDADCADGCCGFNTGLCAGPIIAQERDGGCGFGDAQPNDNAAVAIGFTGPAPTSNNTDTADAVVSSPAASTVAKGTQFITGNCTSDADCADGCCGFNTGLCAGPIVAQERDGGCGFGDAQPNDNAAVAIGFTGPAPTGSNANTANAAVGQASTTFATMVVSSATAGAAAAAGTQFITGPCTSDADCADSCCGFNSGKCAGPIIAQERDGGCGFGDAQPNSIAAQKLGFTG